MRRVFYLMLLFSAALLTKVLAQDNRAAENKQNGEQKVDRIELSQKKHRKLFGESTSSKPELDPELMGILKKFIFGEVFYVGNLDDKLRELITIVSLATQQTMPQLKAHTHAALNIGITPIEIREAVYQCAPFIGFPKTLNAVHAINEVFMERNITLPLENQSTVKEEERYAKGKEIQFPIYGDEIKENMKELPADMGEVVPRFLTELCFGDFYTRKGLEVKTRELLMLCVLATLGTEKQIYAHATGNIKVGNSKETLIAAMIHCLPYIGFPRALNAISIIKSIQ